MNNEYDAELDNVSFFIGYYNNKLHASGKVYNDSKKRFDEGERITTSNIIELQDDILQTKNTKYKVLNFSEQDNEIKEWLVENNIDLSTQEGQMAFKLRWL